METGIFEELPGKLGLVQASKQVLIGMATILVLAAVAVGYVLSSAAATSNFEIEHDAAELNEGASSPEHETIFVHVSGAVCDPGLYELDAGSRVADAITAAGGFSDDALEASCNLARVLDDGEHVIVGSSVQGDGETAGTIMQEGATRQSGGLVNLNTANADELVTLPGIGQSTASKIVADRTANGPFKSVGDLTRVAGIGQKKVEALDGLACV